MECTYLLGQLLITSACSSKPARRGVAFCAAHVKVWLCLSYSWKTRPVISSLTLLGWGRNTRVKVSRTYIAKWQAYSKRHGSGLKKDHFIAKRTEGNIDYDAHYFSWKTLYKFNHNNFRRKNEGANQIQLRILGFRVWFRKKKLLWLTLLVPAN